MVDALLSDAPRFRAYSAELSRSFVEWRDLAPAFETMAAQSPILSETEPRARELSEMGSAGLEALNFLSANVAPPAGWSEAKLGLLDRAAEPRALVRFTMLPAMRLLITAASQVGELNTTAPDQWKKHVVDSAAAAEKKRPSRTR